MSQRRIPGPREKASTTASMSDIRGRGVVSVTDETTFARELCAQYYASVFCLGVFLKAEGRVLPSFLGWSALEPCMHAAPRVHFLLRELVVLCLALLLVVGCFFCVSPSVKQPRAKQQQLHDITVIFIHDQWQGRGYRLLSESKYSCVL